MTSQLLIEMPAEGAARLLTLSLIERATQYAPPPPTNGDSGPARQQVAAYRASVRRLRACLTLYADALGDSVPRKAKRRLRRLADAAETVHGADVQLAWFSRHVPAVGHTARVGAVGEGARAAEWLCTRLDIRRDRVLRALEHARSDARPLRRLAKRLGVYTMAVQLDGSPSLETFARMTSDALIVRADALGVAMRAAHVSDDQGGLRRALRSAEYLGYLLDPIRAYADVEGAIARVSALRTALERLDEAVTVGSAIVRGGRRIAAQHTGNVLRRTIWPVPDAELPNAEAEVRPGDLQTGLVVLAEALHDEVRQGLEGLIAEWEASGSDGLIDAITAIANQLLS